MTEAFKALQKKMLEEHIDAYYVPSGDWHGSEFAADHFKLCEFLSGFTGEAAEILVTESDAYLWTDGRFFIQAEEELKGSGINLMKTGEENIPTVSEFIKAEAESRGKEGYTLGFDGRAVSCDFVSGLKGVNVKSDLDLAGSLWKDRPPLESHKIWEMSLEAFHTSFK